MALTREQVQHVAELAKIKLTDAEIELFREQLSAIVDNAARLDELDTESIPPTAVVLPLHNVMALDQCRPSFPRDAMLNGAPSTDRGYVKVKAVLGTTADDRGGDSDSGGAET